MISLWSGSLSHRYFVTRRIAPVDFAQILIPFVKTLHLDLGTILLNRFPKNSKLTELGRRSLATSRAVIHMRKERPYMETICLPSKVGRDRNQHLWHPHLFLCMGKNKEYQRHTEKGVPKMKDWNSKHYVGLLSPRESERLPPGEQTYCLD